MNVRPPLRFRVNQRDSVGDGSVARSPDAPDGSDSQDAPSRKYRAPESPAQRIKSSSGMICQVQGIIRNGREHRDAMTRIAVLRNTVMRHTRWQLTKLRHRIRSKSQSLRVPAKYEADWNSLRVGDWVRVRSYQEIQETLSDGKTPDGLGSSMLQCVSTAAGHYGSLKSLSTSTMRPRTKCGRSAIQCCWREPPAIAHN